MAFTNQLIFRFIAGTAKKKPPESGLFQQFALA
jgi:hypothetical protein